MLDGRTTDRQRWSLRGPVRTCTVHRTWGGCGGGACGTDTRHDTACVEFRPDGALTLHRHENHDGSAWQMTREYDAEGRLVAQRSGDDSPADGTFYEYDAEGRLARVIARRAGNPERVAETYEYGADGTMKKTEHVECPASGCAGWTTEGSGTGYMADGAATIVVQYNQRGQPVETTFTDSEGRPLTRVTMSYDEDGRLVEEGHTVIDIVLPEAIRAQATAADLEQFRAMLGGGRLQSRQMHRYDAQGRRIETRSAMFGDLGDDRRTFAYNERGDQIEEVSDSSEQRGSIDHNGQVIPDPDSVTKSRSEARFTYRYDSHGNWVEKVVESRTDGRDFSVSSTEIRQLEYWPRMAADGRGWPRMAAD